VERITVTTLRFFVVVVSNIRLAQESLLEINTIPYFAKVTLTLYNIDTLQMFCYHVKPKSYVIKLFFITYELAK
jgi:hypothetical protein